METSSVFIMVTWRFGAYILITMNVNRCNLNKMLLNEYIVVDRWNQKADSCPNKTDEFSKSILENGY